MVVRVRVRLKALKGRRGEVVESVAVANAGYESEGPEVIPVRVAERLGLWPKLPEGTEVQAYEVAGELKVRSYVIEDCLEVQVVAEDAASDPVRAAVMEGESEILMSDASISAHRIVIEDPKRGLWRF
ncbi:MAG: hypothetical protein QW291_08995, partial [Thermofilaceae archaeon]